MRPLTRTVTLIWEGVCRASGKKTQEIQIEDTTLVEVGASISPRNWAGNFWIKFGGMVELTLQANVLIQ